MIQFQSYVLPEQNEIKKVKHEYYWHDRQKMKQRDKDNKQRADIEALCIEVIVKRVQKFVHPCLNYTRENNTNPLQKHTEMPGEKPFVHIL